MRLRQYKNKLSYKNCYGLSFVSSMVTLINAKLSYKNCYGLSTTSNHGFYSIFALSYKNCYGLSIKYTDIMIKHFGLSYKNCYGLSHTSLISLQFYLSYRTKIVMVYLVMGFTGKQALEVIVQKLLWFISATNRSCFLQQNVIVQKLLWFIPL